MLLHTAWFMRIPVVSFAEELVQIVLGGLELLLQHLENEQKPTLLLSSRRPCNKQSVRNATAADLDEASTQRFIVLQRFQQHGEHALLCPRNHIAEETPSGWFEHPGRPFAPGSESQRPLLRNCRE